MRIFTEHDCADEARALFEIADAPKLALAYATQRERVDDALFVPTAAREHSQQDATQAAVGALQHLTHVAPARVKAVLADVGQQEATVGDLWLLCELARTARTARDEGERANAHSAAVRLGPLGLRHAALGGAVAVPARHARAASGRGGARAQRPRSRCSRCR